MGSPDRRMKFALMTWIVLLCAFSNCYMARAQWQGLRSGVGPPISSEIIGESNTIPITSGMLSNFMPNIPNLQFGYQYFFGNGAGSGQFNADYLLPVNIGQDAVVFGEAHGNYWVYGERPPEAPSSGVDFSVGGGYRRITSDNLLAGINGFYDTAKGYNKWYSSGSVGLEMAANVGIADAIDFNANWYYGNLYSSTEIIHAFRKIGNNYDVSAGYSLALFNSALDLRIKASVYKFDVGNNVYGYMTGADLTTRNGMFMFRYEHGNDKINSSWNNFGFFLNVGFLIGNYFSGDNPFTMPDPVFSNGQRNLRRMLSSPVKRAATPVPPTPQPIPPGACNVFVNGNRQLQTATGETFYLQFDSPLDFSRCDPTTTATVTVANPPANPVLVRLYNRSTGTRTCALWITMGTQAITKTDFPDWFAGGPWTDISIENVVNTPNIQGNYWIPVSFTLTYGATLTPQ